jgi:hypothetical protein
VRVLVMVPQNFQRVFVLDNSNRVFASTEKLKAVSNPVRVATLFLELIALRFWCGRRNHCVAEIFVAKKTIGTDLRPEAELFPDSGRRS